MEKLNKELSSLKLYLGHKSTTRNSCDGPHFLACFEIALFDVIVGFVFSNWDILGRAPKVRLANVTFPRVGHSPSLSHKVRV